MGANKNIDLKKCGDILISQKAIKNKSKFYTFRCGFCSVDCDRLKKFSKHLEENHLISFEDEISQSTELQGSSGNPLAIFEPEEIKIEPQIDIEESDVSKKCKTPSEGFNAHDDPLDGGASPKNKRLKESSIEETVTEIVKAEQFRNADTDSSNEGDKMDYDDSFSNGSDSAKGDNQDTTKRSKKHVKELFDMDLLSDESSDDSKDVNYGVEEELNDSKKQPKTKKPKKMKNTAQEKDLKENELVEKDPNAKTKHRRCKKRWKSIDESELPVLIEMYKKYEVLWQVNDIAFGILQKRKETFGKMMEELQTNHRFNKTLDELQDHIDYINYIFHKDREQELKSEIDKTDFKPSSKFYKELSFLGDSQGPFKCCTCNEIIKKYELYHIHVAQHNGTEPFRCRLCDKGFQKFSYYLCHVTRHLGINSYHCKVCGKGYPLKPELDWHLTSHTGDRPYLCPICGAGFRARHTFDNHIRRHENRFRYECHICKHGFNHLGKLNTHIKSHLNIRDVICNVCGKGFTAAKYLKRHKLIHGDEKHFKCNVCGKAFAQDSGLRAHRKQHQPYATVAENKNLLNVFA